VLGEWEKMHPSGAEPAKPVEAAAEPKPGEPAPAPAEPGAEPAKAPEAAPATPKQLAEMMEKTPEFGAFMEAHPEVKGPVFALARKLAEAEPILAIAPTLGDAEFLRDYAGNMVTLKTASLKMIDNPDAVPQFLDLFDSQYRRVDAQGQPILDAQGQPTYDADHAIATGAILSRELNKFNGQFTAETEQLKTKLGGYYPNEQAKLADQQRLDNLEYATVALDVLEQIRDGSYFNSAPPEPPADATAEQKAWFAEQKAELARQHQELDDKRRGAGKEERAAQTAAFTSGVRGDMGMSAGKVIGETLKAAVDSGAYIPQFYLQEKHVSPDGKEMNTPAIAARIFQQFENLLMAEGSKTLLEITQHEMLPQNDQTRQIRRDWYARKAAQLVPALVQKEVDRIQALVRADQPTQEERLKQRNQAAQPEPSTGGSPLPQNASDQQILAAAEEAASKLPEWGSASPRDRQGMLLTQVHRMRPRK
jgi:hypothetical protein